jgi:hypothetical protein
MRTWLGEDTDLIRQWSTPRSDVFQGFFIGRNHAPMPDLSVFDRDLRWSKGGTGRPVGGPQRDRPAPPV